MTGLTFFYIAWIAFIIATFFYEEQNEQRTKFIIIILLAIIFSKYTVPFGQFKINFSGLLFALIACKYIIEKQPIERFNLFLNSFFLCLIYTGIQLFTLYEPIWSIKFNELLTEFIIILLVILLQRQFTEQLIIVLLGIVQGEMLFAITLHKHAIFYRVVNEQCLDFLAIILMSLYVLTIMKQFILKITNFKFE